MPWKEVTAMSLRLEFVRLALTEGANVAQLCRRFGVSRKTGYKWMERFLAEGAQGLANRSRRPRTSPRRTEPGMADAVLDVREEQPAWGGRKIRKVLENRGWANVPAASTITTILKRYGQIDPAESVKHTPWQRFEAEAPNALWQMDFKGHFPVAEGRCHPLTVLDDHSRYSLGLRACANEHTLTVRGHVEALFRHYGLPLTMLVDNGPPWGADARHRYTPLTVWLIRQGVEVVHSRPGHPQTLGKDERFHRSLKAEVVQYCIGLSLEACQKRFDAWRDIYNFHRPHEALRMKVPADRYRPSDRPYREQPPAVEYGADDAVRRVQQGGWISYRGQEYSVPKAFRGERVAVRPTITDSLMDVYYGHQRIAQIDLKHS